MNGGFVTLFIFFFNYYTYSVPVFSYDLLIYECSSDEFSLELAGVFGGLTFVFSVVGWDIMVFYFLSCWFRAMLSIISRRSICWGGSCIYRSPFV